MDPKQIFTLKTFVELLASSFLWLFGSLLYIRSSDYTLVSHSVLLANSGGVLIIILNVIRLLPVHKLEIIGMIVVVIASIIFVNDGGSTKLNGSTNIMYGDILALLSMPFYAVYYLVNGSILTKMPSMVILHLVNIIQLFILFIYFLCTSSPSLFFSFDPHFGVLGWASTEYLLFSLCLVGPIAGILGVGGYIFLLDYFPSHIAASVFLLEPVIGQGIGIVLGQDNFPGWITYFGVLSILFGLGLTIRGDLIKKGKEQNEEMEQNEVMELSERSLLV